MLPMNKLVEDVAEFAKRTKWIADGVSLTGLDMRVQRDNIILFANDMSEKYGDLVSVELVDALIVSYQDSINHKDDKEC